MQHHADKTAVNFALLGIVISLLTLFALAISVAPMHDKLDRMKALELQNDAGIENDGRHDFLLNDHTKELQYLHKEIDELKKRKPVIVKKQVNKFHTKNEFHSNKTEVFKLHEPYRNPESH